MTDNPHAPPASQSDDGLRSRVLTYGRIMPSDEALVLDLILSRERETARAEGKREGIEEAAEIAESYGDCAIRDAIHALAEKQP